MDRQRKKDLLMSDADMVLKYEDNLSMYILYGACAIAENENVIKAYEFLCNADDHYQESAEKECDAFEQSSKSLLYIDEKFKTLKDNIDMENGRWTEKLDEEPEKSIEIY